MFSFRAIYVIVLREFKRFFRQKTRVLVTIARPLIWLVIVGSGFTKIVDMPGDMSYTQFILPGIVGMTILFSSVFSTISVVWDREFGFLREMLVAPISRLTIVVGKLLSGTALSVFQATILVILSPLLGIFISPQQFVWMVLLITLLSLAITSMGLFIASFLKSLEGFNIIMNFIVLPMFFLSGALYPVSSLPFFLNRFTLVNPLSYGIDSFKHILLRGTGPRVTEFPLLLDVGFVIFFSVVMVVLAALSFERKG